MKARTMTNPKPKPTTRAKTSKVEKRKRWKLTVDARFTEAVTRMEAHALEVDPEIFEFDVRLKSARVTNADIP